MKLSQTLCIVFVITVGVIAICRIQPSKIHPKSKHVAGQTVSCRSHGGLSIVYLAPFVADRGVPFAFLAEEWPEYYDNYYRRKPGVPFRAEFPPIGPVPPQVAIWEDGTIIWRKSDESKKLTYYEGKVDDEVIQRIRASLKRGSYGRLDNMRYSNAVFDSRIPVNSLIAVSSGDSHFAIRCHINEMNRVGEYWYRPDGQKEKTFPFLRFSFNEFCDAVPKAYAQYLRDFLELQEQLRSAIPDTGKPIDVNKELHWVVTEYPAPRKTSASKSTDPKMEEKK